MTTLTVLKFNSEGGADNALLIDFLAVEGTTRPFFTRLLLKDANPAGRYFAFGFDVPENSGPFTLAYPFGEILPPDGSGRPDLSQIREIELYVTFLSPPIGSHWSTSIDRIRVANVPEPRIHIEIRVVLLSLLVIARSRVSTYVAIRGWRAVDIAPSTCRASSV